MAIFKSSTILIPLVLAGMAGAAAAQYGAPDVVKQIGPSEKICQLTGDIDWETGRPTASRTLTNFGLQATDLGYPVEHDGNSISGCSRWRASISR